VFEKYLSICNSKILAYESTTFVSICLDITGVEMDTCNRKKTNAVGRKSAAKKQHTLVRCSCMMSELKKHYIISLMYEIIHTNLLLQQQPCIFGIKFIDTVVGLHCHHPSCDRGMPCGDENTATMS